MKKTYHLNFYYYCYFAAQHPQSRILHPSLLHQTRKDALGSLDDQFARARKLGHATPFQHENAIAGQDGRDAMGDGQHRSVCEDTMQGLLDLSVCFGIDGRCHCGDFFHG